MAQKRMIFTVGDRGGTGKTQVAKLLWERLRTRPDALAYDLDGTTGAFAQIYAAYDDDNALVTPQPRSGVTPLVLNAEKRAERDAVIQTLMQAEADVVLCDMPATSLTALERAAKDWSMFEVLEQSGIHVVTVNVVTPFKSSLQNVVRTFELAPRATPVVVLNLFAANGQRDLFFLWDAAEGRKRLQARGGVEVELPALDAKAAILLDAADMTFREAATTQSDLMQRMYVYNWMQKVEAAFAPVYEALGISVEVSA